MKESLQHKLNNLIGLAAFAVVIGAMLYAWQLLSTVPYANLTPEYALIDRNPSHNDIINFHAADHDWRPYTTPTPPTENDAQAVAISWEIPPNTPITVDHILAATTNQDLCVYIDDRLVYVHGSWEILSDAYGRTLHFIDVAEPLAGKRVTFLLHSRYSAWLGSFDYFFIGSDMALFQKISITDAIYTASLSIAASLIVFLLMDLVWRGYSHRRRLQLYLIAFLLSFILWATGTSSLFARLFGTTQIWTELHYIMLYLMPMLFLKITEQITARCYARPLRIVLFLYGILFAIATTIEIFGRSGYINMLFAFYPILGLTFLYPIFVLLRSSWVKHPACRYGVIAAISLMLFVGIDALHFEYHLFTPTLSTTIFSIYAIIPFVFFLIREQMMLDAQLARENSALAQELQVSQDEAKHDFLTGCYNRFQLEPSFERFAGLAEKNGFPFSYAIFDIDHFKEVNDTHGHLAGDQVLRDIAAIIHDEIDRRHIFIRYGGDEFVLLGLHYDLEAMTAFCERLRAILEERMGGVTLSFGVSTWHGGCDSLAGLIARADRALYRSKEKGRNAVSDESEIGAA